MNEVYAATITPPGAGTNQPGVNIGQYFGFGDYTSLGAVLTKLIGPVFSIAAALVIIYFLIASFRYLKAGANKEDMEGARQMLTHGVVGFFILILSFLVIQFILSSLFGEEVANFINIFK